METPGHQGSTALTQPQKLQEQEHPDRTLPSSASTQLEAHVSATSPFSPSSFFLKLFDDNDDDRPGQRGSERAATVFFLLALNFAKPAPWQQSPAVAGEKPPRVVPPFALAVDVRSTATCRTSTRGRGERGAEVACNRKGRGACFLFS